MALNLLSLLQFARKRAEKALSSPKGSISMELRHLRYFIAVAEELSFTRAAAALHVAQSAVSAQIQLLEQDVGVPLLERSSRRVELTAAGRVFLLGARKGITDLEEVTRHARRVGR